MNIGRIVVLTIALGAGGVAAYLLRFEDRAAQVAQPAAQFPTVEILVAKSDIGLGQSVKPDDVQWQSWPAATASSNLIRRDDKADAMKDVIGSIARSPFIAGEPVRVQKLVKADGSGFMAAILPSGMRAISTEISPETGAGGFILPNDRVDVILSRREKDAEKNSLEKIVSEIILSNVRVLAIDQAPKEKEGANSLVGRTVTLELRPEQAETLSRSRQVGSLALALRSIADINQTDDRTEERVVKQGGSVNVVRFGVLSSTTTQK